MLKYFIFLFLVTLTSTIASAVTIIQIPHNDENALANGINQANNDPNELYILEIVDNDGFGFVISIELPIITGTIVLKTKDGDDGVTFTSSGSYDGRFLEVNGNGNLTIKDINKVSNFHSISGGGFLAEGFSIITFIGLDLENLSADNNGGALVCAEGAACFIVDTTFTDCDAGGSGGAVSCLGECDFNNVTFDGNSSDIWACHVDAPFGSSVNIDQCSIRDEENNCGTNFFDVNGGNLSLSNCSIETDNDSALMSCTGGCEINDSLLYHINDEFKSSIQTVCNDFGTDAIQSLGFNIDSGEGCFLDHATDLENTDPMVTFDANNIPQPNVGSPLIESGSVDFVNNVLPCSYKDMNGLGRPQDFDGDGVFTCDRGPVELQGGTNLTNAQSGLFYDVDRNGEGIIVEMLSDTSALVTMFTYHPNKNDLMWFIGVGEIVGNSIVIDEVLRTNGGVFGSSFNADNIVRTDIGGMSIVFPDCSASDSPGRLTFQTGFQFEDELENLLVKSSRLSRLLDCNQSQNNAQSGRSGSFFDPNRSGEGVFIQVLDNGTAVIIFYTYTPDGEQFWLISSDVQIDGDTLTANMVYPASTTGFGSQFNPDEVDLQPWGTLSVEYQPGCSNVGVSYNSTVAGFGSGDLSYQRLTQPAGTTCDL